MFYPFCTLLNLLRIIDRNLVLQVRMLTFPSRFQCLQAIDLIIHLHFPLNLRIRYSKSLELGILKHHLVHILTAPKRTPASHDLADIPLLLFQYLPEVSIKGLLRDVIKDGYLVVFISLPQDTPVTLCQVSRPPWCIQIVQCYQFILHIQSCSHLLRASQQYTDNSVPYLFQQFCPFCVRIGVMYESYLFFLHSKPHHLLSECLIEVKSAVRLRCSLITENELCGMLLLSVMVDFCHTSGTGIEFGVRIVIQRFIQNTGIHGKQPCLVCQL